MADGRRQTADEAVCRKAVKRGTSVRQPSAVCCYFRHHDARNGWI
ncbi:MAG: hypothetical protein AB8G11_02585 [Saprospiraceae bacterium]